MELLITGYRKLVDKAKRIGTAPLMCGTVCYDSKNVEKCMAQEALEDHWIWAFFVIMPFLVFLIDKIIRKKVSFKRFCLMMLCSFPIYWGIVFGGRALFPVLLSWIGIVLVAFFVFIGAMMPLVGVVYGIVVSIKNRKMWHASWPWIVLPLLVLLGFVLAGSFVTYC